MCVVQIPSNESSIQLCAELFRRDVVGANTAVCDVSAGAEEVPASCYDRDGYGRVGSDFVEEGRDAEVAGLGKGVEFLGDGDGDDGDVVAFGEGDGFDGVGFFGHVEVGGMWVGIDEGG